MISSRGRNHRKRATDASRSLQTLSIDRIELTADGPFALESPNHKYRVGYLRVRVRVQRVRVAAAVPAVQEHIILETGGAACSAAAVVAMDWEMISEQALRHVEELLPKGQQGPTTSVDEPTPRRAENASSSTSGPATWEGSYRCYEYEYS